VGLQVRVLAMGWREIEYGFIGVGIILCKNYYQ